MNAKKGVYNIVFGILGQALTVVFAIIVPKVIIEYYGSEVNGLLSSISQILVYLGLFEAGVGTASLQALYQPIAEGGKKDINSILSATNKYYKRTSKLYFAALVVFSVIYPFVVKNSLNTFLVMALIFFGGLGNVVNFMYQGKYKILLQAEGKSYIVTNITTIVNVLINVGKIILIIAGFQVLAVQVVFFAFNVLQMALFEIYIHKNYGWIDLSVEPNEAAISQKNSVLIHQISTLVFSNTDVLVLSVFSGLKVVSVYTVYNYIYSTVLNLFNTVNNGLVFYLGQNYHKGKEHFIHIYRVFELDITVFGYYVFTVIGVLTLPFMNLYTKNMTDYNYIDKLLPVLFLTIQLLSIARFASNNLINIAGHFKKTQSRSIAESAINLIVSFLAVYKFGIYGVLIGTIVAMVYRTNDMIIYANHRILQTSVISSYRIMIVNILTAVLCMILFYDKIHWAGSYMLLIGAGIVYGIIILGIFLAVNLICNWNLMKTNFSMVKQLIKRKIAC